jgi:hypothetical protein
MELLDPRTFRAEPESLTLSNARRSESMPGAQDFLDALQRLSIPQLRKVSGTALSEA